MDVVKISAFAALAAALAACAPNKTTESVFRGQSSSCGGAASETRFIVGWEDGSFSVETARDEETLKKNFVGPNLSRIRFVEHDRVVRLSRPVAAEAAAGADSWGQNMVNASSVWTKGVSGAGIVVGIVDSQIDISHAQLSGRIAVNTAEIPGNGIDDDGNGYVDDVNGVNFISASVSNPQMNAHGTHVAGIIAADPARGSVSGIAPQARIVPAPFINNDGWGNLGDAITAMQYTAKRGARVINASWGGPTCMTAMSDAFAELGRQGVLVVVAAGNEGVNIEKTPSYPAAFGLPNQLTVAASTNTDALASFSNFGSRLVQLSAPGLNIVSTFPGGTTGTMSGTSMAAPFVTGAAALIWSARPSATVAQVRQALLKVQFTGHAVSTGGRLDIGKAYDELLRLVP